MCQVNVPGELRTRRGPKGRLGTQRFSVYSCVEVREVRSKL